MGIEEPLKKKTETEEEESSTEADAPAAPAEDKLVKVESAASAEAAAAREAGDEMLPAQLGHKRFVYAAYLAGAVAIAFLATKALDYGWFKLSSYRPEVGEARDEIV